MCKSAAKRLVDLYRRAQYLAPIDELYADDVVSIEAEAPPDGERQAQGKAVVRARHEAWLQRVDIHDAVIEGPYLHGDDRFAVRMRFDVTRRKDERRLILDEVALYQVRDDRIAREEFFYAAE